MLRYKTKLDMVYLPCTTSGQETDRVLQSRSPHVAIQWQSTTWRPNSETRGK